MKQYCHAHPTQLSHWYCPKCHLSYCPQCIIVRNKNDYAMGEKIHLCPKCVTPAEWIAASNTIVPFWNRLHKHFIYPLAWHPMLLITIVTFFRVMISRGPVGLVLNIVLWGVMIKYAFAVLKETAQGRLIPPKVSYKTISEDFSDAFKWLIIFFVIVFVFSFVAQKLGAVPAAIFLIFALISLPAMIILFISTGSLVNALNPMLFVRLIFRIGWGYALMYFFLFLLAGAPYVLEPFLVDILPLKLFIFLIDLASAYYLLIVFNLMGYVLLQYHEDIGYQINFDDFIDTPSALNPPEPNNPATDTLNQLNLLLKDGKFESALDFLAEYAQGNTIQDLKLSQKYYELLVMKKRDVELARHCPDHLELLASSNQSAKALDVYRKCLERNKGFTPSATTLLKIGGWLNETGKAEEAIQVLRTLVDNYPDNPLVPKAFFRAAQIFNDRLMNPEKAAEILTDIIENYPASEITQQAKNYLAHIGPSA